MKKLGYLFLYELKYAFLGIRRHLLLCLSAMSAIAISLVLIVVFVVLGLHVDHFAGRVEHDLSIHVVLEDSIQEQKDIDKIEKELKAIKNIDKIVFSDKDKELELMIEEKGDAFEIYRGDTNPLAHAFFVYVKDGSKIDKTAKAIEKLDSVVSVAYGGDSVTRLMDMLDITRKVGYGVALLLLLLSLYLIYNTIRTTIYSRQDEIIIMRQVGASNAFIKIPFETEGVLIGIFGSLIPLALVVWGYPKLYEMMDGQLFINKFSLMEPNSIMVYMGVGIVCLGAFIGWLASQWAVTKYLKIKR